MAVSRLTEFLSDRSGHFALLFSVAAIPLLVGMGIAVDYSRLINEKSLLQNVSDGAALAAVISGEANIGELRERVQNHLAANYASRNAGSVTLQDLIAEEAAIRVTLRSTVPMVFAPIIGVQKRDVVSTSVAARQMSNLEVALVLDNTWSMSELDPSGNSKIASLKTAALTLVNEVTKKQGANVKIAVVPYADYVNVGVRYRNEPWLSIPADYTVQPKPRTCQTLTTKSVCVQRAPTYSCTQTVDGVSEPSTCGGGCTKSETQQVPPYQSCSGGGPASNYTWFGCVGSRTDSDSRLHDRKVTKTYPGYVDTQQKCLTPIVPLTNKKTDVMAAIDGMILNLGSYKPATYIPAGVIWGLNVLSPNAPFTEAAAYDPGNRKPRKVMVLMTDGENTLRFSASDGRHVSPNSNASKAAGELKKSDSDTAQICRNMKAENIEIFTIAFMVDNATSEALLKDCASDADHYFDASDGEKLMSVFQTIASSLTTIRLTQ